MSGDANNDKYAVTHVLDSFSLYQIAVASKDPCAETATELLRDRWFGIFGPPIGVDDRSRNGVQGSLGVPVGHVCCFS